MLNCHRRRRAAFGVRDNLSAQPERARTTRFRRPRRCRSPHGTDPSTTFRATFTAIAIRPLLGAERGGVCAKSEILKIGIFLSEIVDRTFAGVPVGQITLAKELQELACNQLPAQSSDDRIMLEVNTCMSLTNER